MIGDGPAGINVDYRYRVGGHWHVTVVEYDNDEPADKDGRRTTDRLICMATSEIDAQRIVTALNGDDPYGEP